MEFLVYILYSEKFDKTYVGFTSSLIERFKSHNELANSGFTTKFRPWLVLYVEVLSAKSDALKREKWFKTGVGREKIKAIKNELLLK